MNALRFLLLLAVAPLLSCDLLSDLDPLDNLRSEKPEAVTVEASVDGLTITVTWTDAIHAARYRVELFENPPGRGLLAERGASDLNRLAIFTEANDSVRVNNTYTVTVFSWNAQHGETRSANSPTVRT